MRALIGLAFLPFALSAVEPAAFFEKRCVQCHGPKKQKAKLRLDTLDWTPDDLKNLQTWREIADKLELREMPPEDEPQPSPTERTAMLHWLGPKLAAASTPEPVLLRRLNRTQYRNTLRDLVQIDVFAEDPTTAFPADDEEHGFDNLGATLQMSDFLLRQYLKVARLAVDRATFEGERPEAKTYTLMDEKSRALNFKAPGNDKKGRGYVVLYRNDERAPGDPRGQQFINSREGASHDGWYQFTFEVESKGRGTMAKEFSEQKRNDYQVYRPEDLHRFEIYITAPSGKFAIQTRPRRLILSVDLPDNKPKTIRQRIWVPAGWRVEAGFGNGYWGVRDPLTLVDPEFDMEAFRKLPRREQNERYGKLVLNRFETLNAPRIVVRDVVETGPHYEQWPPQSHLLIHGKPGQSKAEVVRNFAERAFRRPVTPEHLAPYLKLAEDSPEGIRTAIEAILCSPRFLYFNEPPGNLDDYAIASRLSYFLWNTMPDDALMADARKGKLSESATLKAQLKRMLANDRSEEFVKSFVWAWLRLENTVEMAPDPMKFYEYHRNRIADSMLIETTAFFRHLLMENLPVSNFIDSDFAIINADLGRHYGMPGKVKTTAKFKRVDLKPEHRRGGLLGQASVLTASANGVDTSPVVRGIWILENLLGTPPSPPPPDVDVPEPDSRGELTIRQLYAKHRTVESCNDCHKKIDPLGFALENYDAVGVWRTSYESDHPVDPSGRMPNGESFDDLVGLKAIMTSDLTLFTRNLTTKLLTYATGRTMGISDRPEIDRLATELEKQGGGLLDLMQLVVTSETFLNK
tara:strand:- start:1064 stop:3472 length:2409 start_codon:yes stop_codon:yes gene_type:complete